MSSLIQHISRITFVTPPLKSAIESSFLEVKTFKNDLLLEENSRADHLYFIEKGVLHNYYYHDDKRVTSWFYTEGMFITSWSSFYGQKASFETIECLEDCSLYRISYTDYQKLIADFPAFNNFARILTEKILTEIDHFSKSWSFLSAREKYQLMQNYFPGIELRVKLGLIASFLGISQETLSRIRTSR